MNRNLQNLTQLDLKAFGISDYLVREICRGLKFSQIKGGVKEYKLLDIKASIEKKLSQAQTRPKTRKDLQIVLDSLESKSNIVEVDFLKKLTPKERTEFLKNRREELRAKGEVILQQTDELLKKAKKFT
jgi:hypothetical protein